MFSDNTHTAETAETGEQYHKLIWGYNAAASTLAAAGLIALGVGL